MSPPTGQGLQPGQVITDSSINNMLSGFSSCMVDMTGVSIPGLSDNSGPGLGSIMTTMIRSVEKGLTTSFEPIVDLIGIVKNAANPADLATQLTSFASDFQQMSQNPEQFIINQLLEPVTTNMTIPIPNPTIMPQILLDLISGKALSDILSGINFTSAENILLPPKFQTFMQNNEQQANVILSGITGLISGAMHLIMIPIQAMIQFFIAFVKMILDAINPTDIVSFIGQWSNPVKGLMTMLGKIFGDVVGSISSSLFPGISTSGITSAVTGIFTGELDRNAIKSLIPTLGPAGGLLGMTNCSIEWTISFIEQVPTLILST